MKHWQRFALRVVLALGALLLLGGGFYWFAISALDGPCGNDIVSTELSPDRTMKAVLFERDCGATTGFSSQVSVLRADEDLPDDGGNVFAANAGKRRDGTSLRGPFVEPKWRDVRTLLLRYDAGADIRFKTDHLGDVTVAFQALP